MSYNTLPHSHTTSGTLEGTAHVQLKTVLTAASLGESVEQKKDPNTQVGAFLDVREFYMLTSIAFLTQRVLAISEAACTKELGK